MHYLIDGHNLIAKMPDISLADPDDEAQLALRLRGWTAGDRRRRVTVVFDGGLPGGEATALSGSSVTVVFAPAGRTADSLLIRRIQAVNNPAEYTLVSSDRELMAAARARRMPCLPSEKFVPLLKQGQQPSAPPAERENPRLSPGEIEEWLELFDQEQNS